MPQVSLADSDFLLYDGECPFCSAYVRMQRLRAAGIDLQLLDARDQPGLVAQFAREGLDIDQGMILRLGGSTYFGGDVMHMIALLSGPTGMVNRVMGWVFSNQTVANVLYPPLRTGRNATLKLLGRGKLEPPAPTV